MPGYVIFTMGHFTKRDWERFDCPVMQAHGYTPIPVEAGAVFGWSTGRTGNADPGVVVLKDAQELDAFVTTLNDSDIVLVLANLTTARMLFRVLSRHDVRYVVLQHRPLPISRLRSLRAAISVRELFELKFEDLASWLYRLRRWLREMTANRFEYFRLRAPALWINAGGRTSWMDSGLPKVWLAPRRSMPHFDYLLAVNVRAASASEAGLAVFLDEAFVDHPDFAILNVPKVATQERYWPAMDRLFQSIERETGLSVVVARHPRGTSRLPPAIEARLRPELSTAELVKQSNLVICHASTSVTFAVTFRKPIMFVTTQEIDRSKVFRGLITRLSSFFGQRRVNADDFRPSDVRIPAMRTDRYESYEQIFLRPQARAGESVASILLQTLSGSERALAKLAL